MRSRTSCARDGRCEARPLPALLEQGGTLRTVLIVDDDTRVAAATAQILQRRGYNVVAATLPDAALSVMAETPVHLIIADVNMPGLRGPELLARVRASGVDVPVVFMSGDHDVKTLEESLSVSNSAFLAKPFSVHELVTAVTENLR